MSQGLEASGRWPAERVVAWLDRHGPVIGCNYVPRSAVNATEMWQEATFDPPVIDEELGWAKRYGYNSLRVFLSFMAWREDPSGSLARFEQFLAISAKHGMSVLVVPFDDVCFSGKEPYSGPQDPPRQNVHNSAWVPSPGHVYVADHEKWHEPRRFLLDFLEKFAVDSRVIGWDLYNEPGNHGIGEQSLPFMAAVIRWARDAKVDQPLTIGIWQSPAFSEAMQALALGFADFVSFHCYNETSSFEGITALCASKGRPVVCTEWLHRPRGNTFDRILPVMQTASVGWYHWGLVAGRTQTNLLWDVDKSSNDDQHWLADVLQPDGRPYVDSEMEQLQSYLASLGLGAHLPK